MTTVYSQKRGKLAAKRRSNYAHGDDDDVDGGGYSDGSGSSADDGERELRHFTTRQVMPTVGGGSACTSLGHCLNGNKQAFVCLSTTRNEHGQLIITKSKMPSVTEQLLLYYKNAETRRRKAMSLEVV